jgi:hypothetical protein
MDLTDYFFAAYPPLKPWVILLPGLMTKTDPVSSENEPVPGRNIGSDSPRLNHNAVSFFL